MGLPCTAGKDDRNANDQPRGNGMSIAVGRLLVGAGDGLSDTGMRPSTVWSQSQPFRGGFPERLGQPFRPDLPPVGNCHVPRFPTGVGRMVGRAGRHGWRFAMERGIRRGLLRIVFSVPAALAGCAAAFAGQVYRLLKSQGDERFRAWAVLLQMPLLPVEFLISCSARCFTRSRSFRIVDSRPPGISCGMEPWIAAQFPCRTMVCKGTPRLESLAFAVYMGFPIAAGGAQGWFLKRRKAPAVDYPGVLILSAMLAFGSFFLFPVSGPRENFRELYPGNPLPVVESLVPAQVENRNCMPSLHMVWATTLWWFSRGISVAASG